MLITENNCQIFKKLKKIHKDLVYIKDDTEEPILVFENGIEMYSTEFILNSKTRTLMDNIDLFD